ncbi:hypothetical protein QUF72_08425 [Desulfobacterales bacterium HSG2]|nr:hypothetical protein [Desulfobacterales bacterium HSG2]
MDPLTLGFSAAYLANIGAALTKHILSTGTRRIRKALTGTEEKKALDRCVRAGVVALLSQCNATSDEVVLLKDIFERFFDEPDTARELSGVLTGKQPDMEEMNLLFQDAGYDPDTLPGIAFDRAITAFEAAFLAGAAHEPILQPVIQTSQLLEQTRIQRDILTEMRKMAAFLKESKPETIGISAGTIIAENVVSGEMLSYTPRSPTQAAEDNWENFYLKRLMVRCESLDLAAIDETWQEEKVRVSDVFTTLYLKGVERLPDQSVSDAIRVPIQAAEAAGAMMIQGRPGEAVERLSDQSLFDVRQKISDERFPFRPLKLPAPWTGW